MRLIDADALKKDLTRFYDNEVTARQLIDEQPTIMQEPKTDVLDKIRAEIEQTTSRYCLSRERGTTGQLEWSDRLIKESDVLQIIEKYTKGDPDV